MEINATLIDFERVYNSIDGLKDIEKNRVIKQGLSDATKVFMNAGKSNLKARLKNTNGVTGNLSKSFKKKLKRSKLGALAGFNFLGMHSHLIDEGTQTRTNKRGQNRGKVIGNHFWKDAINSNQSTAINKVYEGIERGIEKLMERNR